MDHELVDILDSNPWSEMATKIRNALETNSLSMGRFVLPMDERIISEFEADHKGDETELRLNLPPQPFIGNPEAKIWIVQFNPGYSSIIDDYDYLGIDNLPCRSTLSSAYASIEGRFPSWSFGALLVTVAEMNHRKDVVIRFRSAFARAKRRRLDKEMDTASRLRSVAPRAATRSMMSRGCAAAD